MPRHARRAACAVAVLGAVACAAPAEARITRLEIARVEPAFGGRSFGAVGTFERVVGRAYGEVDPPAPASAAIQDVGLAPTNARGMVEYATDVDIIRPADPARGNKVLLFNILNRGNKGGAEPVQRRRAAATWPRSTRLTDPGDGWLQRQGYTLVWFGWQADVLPGDGRMTLSVPVARNPDGSPITGVVRSELWCARRPPTLSLAQRLVHRRDPRRLSVGQHRQPGRPSPDGFLPTLTVRAAGERAPRADPEHAMELRAAAPPGSRRRHDPARLLPGGVPARQALRAGLPRPRPAGAWAWASPRRATSAPS